MLEDNETLSKELKSHGIVDVNVEDVQRQLADFHDELVKNQQASASSDEIDMSILDDILGEEKSQKLGKEQAAAATAAAKSGESSGASNSTVWENLVKEKVGMPKTGLEKERHSFYSQVEMQSFENIASDDDVEHFKQIRYEINVFNVVFFVIPCKCCLF